jgi:hypothetical protein
MPATPVSPDKVAPAQTIFTVKFSVSGSEIEQDLQAIFAKIIQNKLDAKVLPNEIHISIEDTDDLGDPDGNIGRVTWNIEASYTR